MKLLIILSITISMAIGLKDMLKINSEIQKSYKIVK